MRVKIVRNTQGDRCWYAGKVGHVFRVSPYYHFGMATGDWVGFNLDGSREECLIAAEDCEELDAEAPKPGTENEVVQNDRH